MLGIKPFYETLKAMNAGEKIEFWSKLAIERKKLKVYNFSHPLTQLAIDQIEALLQTEIEIVTIPCQLDMEKPLALQLHELCKEIKGNYPYIIPPGMGAAAAILVKTLTYHSEQMNMSYEPIVIWLKRDNETNTFELGGIE